MNSFFERSIPQNFAQVRIFQFASSALHCIAGSIFMGLMSQFSVSLPFTPIPISLQTLALFLLILAQGQKKASYSIVLYLAQASMGLPVLNGGLVNPAWMLGPTAGYLIGFLACAWVSGYLIEKNPRYGFCWTVFSLFCGQVVLFAMGTAYLSCFVGFNHAVALGVAPFLVAAALKLTVAGCSAKPIDFISRNFLESR